MAIHHVRVSNSGFAPSSLTIAAGDSVCFRFEDLNLNVASDVEGLFASEANVGAGQERSVHFPSVGRFPYHSRTRPGMVGEIIVE